jgi:gamma-glutamyltranspeptidase/glutathione hydrolase
MPIDEAIKDQRVYVMPDLSKQWEDGLNNDVLEKLSEMVYQFDQTFREEGADTRIGDVQAIMIDHADDRRLYGGADFPRPGEAKGL